jgi:superfamily II DNA or RNA helicase
MLRKHQERFDELCRDIAAGRVTGIKSIICNVTPGGGKSLLPLIASAHLLERCVDRLCWIVPRRSLQVQAEAEFQKPAATALMGGTRSIRRSANVANPCRGLDGFVTTYQALGVGNHHFIDDFDRHRYLLVLDEPHHVEEGGAWETALAPLIRRAALTVFMSGTLERGNRRRIAFLPYHTTSRGEFIDLRGAAGTAAINYSRRDALCDRAILPIHFELMDGSAQWIGRDGETYSTRLSTANKDTAEAVYTALKTGFATELLEECAAHWSDYRRTRPRSKLLVVTANIDDAKKYVEHLQKKGISAAIATSDDAAGAAANIAHFKRHSGRRALDALVTVAMAYEGLDVPAVTHIACLTHIRSKPWIEQMIARATRFDAAAGAWDEQTAYLYVPDDRNMCAIITHMQEEQTTAVKQIRDAEEYEELLARYEENEERERSTITPVNSQGAGRRFDRVGSSAAPGSSESASDEPPSTPSEQEAALRESIQSYCRQVDLLYFERRWGETNRRVVRYFSRPRTIMSLRELQQVRAWLEANYPLQAATRTATPAA